MDKTKNAFVTPETHAGIQTIYNDPDERTLRPASMVILYLINAMNKADIL